MKIVCLCNIGGSKRAKLAGLLGALCLFVEYERMFLHKEHLQNSLMGKGMVFPL